MTAKQYYQNPEQLPSGYTYAHQILGPPNTPDDVMYKIVYNQYITQILTYSYLKNWLALRFGDDPSGLVPFNTEINWVLGQLDQKIPVEITLFSNQFPWFDSHAVLAYGCHTSGNDVLIDIYGPNIGNAPNQNIVWNGHQYTTDNLGGQQIHLVKDSNGNYAIANGITYLEGFGFSRFGGCEAPTDLLGPAGDTLLMLHLPEIIDHLNEYLIQQGLELLSTKAECPVNLILNTSDGLRVGYDSAKNSTVNELSSAMYSGPFTDPQLITLIAPVGDNYTISTKGYGSGNYTLSVTSIVNSSVINSSSWTKGIVNGQSDKCDVQLSTDGTLTFKQVVTSTPTANPSSKLQQPTSLMPLTATYVAVTVAVIAVAIIVTAALALRRRKWNIESTNFSFLLFHLS